MLKEQSEKNLYGTLCPLESQSHNVSQNNLSQNAKRASARKDTGLDQSLFYVQLFRLRINII